MTNAYCTVEDLRAAADITVSAGDPGLTRAVNAASRMIDHHCGRRFYLDTAVSARTYRATDIYTVDVDDFSTTTGLIVKTDNGDDGTFETTWTVTTDYEARPVNRTRGGLETWAYTQIAAVGGRRFPVCGLRNQVQVTALWGWPSVPDDVAQACVILALRIYGRKDSPQGVLGGIEFGAIRVGTRLDPDVEMLLAPYRKVIA